MINTAKTAAAASLAQRAHSGQLDKAGEPYVKHAFAVAEKMDDEDSTCAALLHDVVEDTDFTLDDLRAIGMSEAVVEAVDLLTCDPDQDYFAYVLALRDHPIASKVKRADLEHNAAVCGKICRAVFVNAYFVLRNVYIHTDFYVVTYPVGHGSVT